MVTVAYETFHVIGATSWSRRAAEQMRAAGLTAPQREWSASDRLSEADLTIAQLAASGLSNREIGERLHLSPRTIGSRLYRIFPRLGISSRTLLRDALERAQREQEQLPTRQSDIMVSASVDSQSVEPSEGDPITRR
jgi:DNA-binding CsgD family transcriptional regulator